MSKNKAISSYLEDYYWYWFCNIPRIGKTKLRQLLMVFESPEHVYKADVEVLRGLGSLSDKELMSVSERKEYILRIQERKITHKGCYIYMIILYVCIIMESCQMIRNHQLQS